MSETTMEAPAPVEAVNHSFTFFKKVLNNLPFYVDGQPVQFEALDKNRGVLKISALDPRVPVLNAAAAARKGGIVLIDEPTYEELKKKLPLPLLAPRSPPSNLRVAPVSPPKALQAGSPPRPRSGVAAAADSVFVPTKRISSGIGVGPVGGGGTGEGAGTPAPVPAPALPGEFKPATGKKYPTPRLRKATGNSLNPVPLPPGMAND